MQSFLGLDDTETRRSLRRDWSPRSRGFVYVRREVDLDVGEQIANLRLVGVNVDAEDRQVLPGGTVGLSVIGRTDIDGVGIAGLEKQYDEMLTGIARRAAARRSRRRDGRSPAPRRITAVPVPGDDVILTLDRSIQFAAENLLVGRVSELGAKSGTIIVMDTETGDVYAMASVVRNDEDGVVEVTSGNFAAVNAYEPGSVAKVITIAAGAEPGDRHRRFDVRRALAQDSTPTTMLEDSHQHPDDRDDGRGDLRRVVEHRHDRRPAVARQRVGHRPADALGVHAQLRSRREDGARFPR